MQWPGHRYRILNQSMAGQSAKGIFMNQLSMFTMVYTPSIKNNYPVQPTSASDLRQPKEFSTEVKMSF